MLDERTRERLHDRRTEDDLRAMFLRKPIAPKRLKGRPSGRNIFRNGAIFDAVWTLTREGYSQRRAFKIVGDEIAKAPKTVETVFRNERRAKLEFARQVFGPHERLIETIEGLRHDLRLPDLPVHRGGNSHRLAALSAAVEAGQRSLVADGRFIQALIQAPARMNSA